jgi:hypothetical protein
MTTFPTERHYQAAVIDLARRCDFLVFHDVDSRRNRPGFLDLVLVHKRTGRLLFWELKTDKGRVRPEQQEWLEALQIRHEAAVIRPQAWAAVQDVLIGERKAAA